MCIAIGFKEDAKSFARKSFGLLADMSGKVTNSDQVYYSVCFHKIKLDNFEQVGSQDFSGVVFPTFSFGAKFPDDNFLKSSKFMKTFLVIACFSYLLWFVYTFTSV